MPLRGRDVWPGGVENALAILGDNGLSEGKAGGPEQRGPGCGAERGSDQPAAAEYRWSVFDGFWFHAGILRFNRVLVVTRSSKGSYRTSLAGSNSGHVPDWMPESTVSGIINHVNAGHRCATERWRAEGDTRR